MSVSHPQIDHGSDSRSALIPDDREGHTASVIGQKIYVFGGTWTDDDDRTIYMNDLHVLDVSNYGWSRPSWTGTPPIEREGHSASVVGPLIYIFAGTWVDIDVDETSVYLNDLHVLDTRSTAWSQPATSGLVPSQREGHTAAVVGERIYVFGGAVSDIENKKICAGLGTPHRAFANMPISDANTPSLIVAAGRSTRATTQFISRIRGNLALIDNKIHSSIRAAASFP